MEQDEILRTIHNFYPRNISSFDVAYNETEEYRRLRTIIKTKDNRWNNFLDRMIEIFKADYVQDRSDEEPSNRCVIYIYKGDILFEIVVHISLIINYFSFYITKAFVDKINIRTQELAFVENEVFPEIENECTIILDAIKEHYNYKLIPTEVSRTLLPDVATLSHDLGEATVFNALFAEGRLSPL